MLDRVKGAKTEKLPGVAEILPWLFVANDDCSIVATKNSMLLAAWEYEGVDIESIDHGALVDAAASMDYFFREHADLTPVFWVRMDRHRTGYYPHGDFDNQIARGIDRVWADQITDGAAFLNRCYLYAALPTAYASLGMVEAVRANMASGTSYQRAFIQALYEKLVGARRFGFTNRRELDRWIEKFESTIIASVENGALGVTTRRLKGGELLGALRRTVSANNDTETAVNLNEYLDEYLSDSFIDNSIDDELILEGNRKRHVAVFTLKKPPEDKGFYVLEPLYGLDVELSIASCWRAMTMSDADKFLRQARAFDEIRSLSLKKVFRGAISGTQGVVSASDEPRTEVGAMAEFMRSAMRGCGAAFGWLATSIIVYADSTEELEDAVEKVERELARSQLVFFREREGALSGFCVGIPGQTNDPVRWHFTEASAFTNVMPLITLSADRPIHPFFSEGRDKPLPPNATFLTRYRTPYYFNYHMGQLGHTLLIGPSRNGKTVLQMFLESQSLKYPGSMIFNIDKDLSLKPTTLLLDGIYIDLSPDRMTVKMNPLSVINDDLGKAWLIGWLDRLMSNRGKPLTDKEVVEVSRAVDRVVGIPGARLSTLASQLPEELRSRLLPWCQNGVWGMFFDNEEDNFALSRITSVEVGGVLAAGMHDVVSAFTDYAFFRIERFLMNRPIEEIGPTMIYFEEAGYLLDDEIFAAKARDYLMTLAKKRAFLVMTAQSPEPFIVHPKLGAAVRDNTATIIFMPNHQADRELGEKYKKAFGVSDGHLQLIVGAKSQRQYCVFKPQIGSFRVIEAQFPPSIIAALRSDAKSIAILDRHYDKEDPTWKERYLNAVQFA